LTSTILLSAGDASGDLHAASLVRAIRERRPDVRFFGLGGIEMEKAGVELVADQKDLAVGGLVELAGSVLRLVRAWRRMLIALREIEPDLVILVDSGGFNLPFARRVRRRGSARILYYVAPQVWAWRPGRIRKLAARVDHMAVIFPFEPEAYAQTSLPVDFVGHPLVETLREVAERLSQRRARELLNLDRAAPLIVLLPGSRRNEIAHQLPIQLAAAHRLHRRDPRIGFVIAGAPSIAPAQLERLIAGAELPASMRLRLVVGRTHEAIRAADVVLAKPGTGTVEIMLLGRPMVVMGRVNAFTAALLRRAVVVPFFAMPNLIAAEQIVPELLQEFATPSAIADALHDLLDGAARDLQIARLAEASRTLGDGGAAEGASRIAEELLGPAPA
jgi:lipid-A-disaccharide synthase